MAVALKELQTDGTGHELLGIGHKGVERVLERAVPLAVIHGGGPILLELNLGLEQVALNADVLKRLVGGDKRQGAGNLIALTALEAHQTILNKVETAKAVVARNLVEGDDDLGEFHLLAVDGDGLAGLKLNLGIRRGIGRVLGILGHNPGVVERLVPGILQVAALNGTTPQVVVDGIGVVVGTLGNRHVVGVSIGDLVGTALQIPLANWGDNLKLGVEGLDGSLEADLVVTLAGAAVGDVGRAKLVSDLDKLLGEQRARQGGKQRVLVLVHGVCSDGLGQELIRELVAQVEHLAIKNAQVERLLFLGIQAGLLLAHVAADANDIEILLVLEPLDTYGCIKTTGICENDFFLAHGCFLSPLVAN